MGICEKNQQNSAPQSSIIKILRAFDAQLVSELNRMVRCKAKSEMAAKIQEGGQIPRWPPKMVENYQIKFWFFFYEYKHRVIFPG